MSIQNLFVPNDFKIYVNELLNDNNIVILTTNPIGNLIIGYGNTLEGTTEQTSSIVGFNNIVASRGNSGTFGDNNQVLGSSYLAYCFGSDNTLGTNSSTANQSLILGHNSSTTANNSIVIGNSATNTTTNTITIGNSFYTCNVNAILVANSTSTFVTFPTFKTGIISGSTGTTYTINANAGTGATVTSAELSDGGGSFTLNTGTSLSLGVQITINFGTAYVSSPKSVVFSAMNSITSELMTVLYITNVGTTSFSIAARNPFSASTSYSISYVVIG